MVKNQDFWLNTSVLKHMMLASYQMGADGRSRDEFDKFLESVIN